jgi:hypothetical protein
VKRRHCIIFRLEFKSVFRSAAFVWLLSIPSILPRVAWAQTLPAHRVFVVLTPGLRADDLTSPLLPALRLLRSEGAAGWMVCRAARATDRRQLAPDGRDTPSSLALTLGSGTRALAEERERGEEREKGEIGPSSPSVSSLRDINRAVDHIVPIGALGAMIHRSGWRTALLGSAQTDDTFEMGRLLAMDGTGQIDVMPSSLNNLNNLTDLYKGIADVSAPYGRRDDVQALVKEATELDSRFALVVIAFGDLARADRYGPLCLPPQSARHRANALRALNELVSVLRQRLAVRRESLDASTPTPRLYLLSPAPAPSTNATDKITPVCLWGDGVPVGTLTSPSTRTTGIVVNTDFLPTVAADLGLPPPSGAIGRPFAIQATPTENTAIRWKWHHDRLLQSERLKDVYGGLPTGQILLVLAALWTFRKQKRQLAGALAIVIVSLPLGMLLLPSLPFVPHSVLGAGLMLTAFVFLLALLAWCAYPHPQHLRYLLLIVCAALTAAIVLDLLTGSPLLREAWMSYSVMETARFYGIGNEYMGAVIGAACILLGERDKAQDTRHKAENTGENTQGKKPATNRHLIVSCLLCLLLVFILGYNRFGAKVGAVPSVGCALGVEMLVLWRGRVRMGDVGAVLLGAGLLLGVLVLMDMRHAAGEQSHLARAFLGGGGNILAIARRKLSLEGYLLLHSPWSLGLLCAAGTFWIVGRERQFKIQNPKSKIVTAGLVTGAVVSLLCNDSGVTAAAMIMLFGCAWTLIEAVTTPHA